MIYGTLGRTGLKVSAVGFGGGPLQSVEYDESKELLEAALDAGMNIFDVDKVHKSNEEKLSLLKNRRDEHFIATKSLSQSRQDMERDIAESLALLQTEYIDIYQLHMVNTEEDLKIRMEGAMKALKKAQTEGKIGFIGITGHNIPTLIKAVKTNEFDTIMVAYNTGHTIADELLNLAKTLNLGVLSMKPLGGGFLVDPKYANGTNPEMAKKMTLKNALTFSIFESRIDCTFLGINQLRQVKELKTINFDKISLSDKQKKSMQAAVRNFLGDDYCRTCKYCLPCANNPDLEIDEILRLKGFSEKYGYSVTPQQIYGTKVTALACEKCYACVKKCPYKIDIPKRLSEAHEILCTDENRYVVSMHIESKYDEEWKEKLEQWMQEGNNPSVIEFARENLKEYPNNIALLNFLGPALFYDGNEAEAEKVKKKLLELKSDIHRFHEAWGNAYYERGRISKAMKEYELHIKSTTSYSEKLHAKYRIAICKRLLLKGQKSFFKLIGGNKKEVVNLTLISDNDKVWKNQMEKWMLKGEHKKVIDFAKVELRRFPNNVGLLGFLGSALFFEGFESEGEAIKEKLFGLDPGAKDFHMTWASVYFERGRYSQAMTEYLSVLKADADKDKPELDEILDRIDICKKLAKSGGKTFSKLIGKNQKNVVSMALTSKFDNEWRKKFNKMNRAGKLTEAIDFAKVELRRFPNDVALLDFLGPALFFEGFESEGEAVKQKLFGLDPNVESFHEAWGNVYFEKGNFSKALNEYKIVLKNDLKTKDISEDELNRRIKLSKKLVKVGGTTFTKLTQTNLKEVMSFALVSKFDEDWSKKLEKWMMDGDNLKVIDLAKENLRKFPNDVALLDFLGPALFNEGFIQEAEAYKQKLLELRPDLPNFHEAWGNAYFGRAKYSEAIREYETYLNTLNNKAEINRVQKRIEKCKNLQSKNGKK